MTVRRDLPRRRLLTPVTPPLVKNAKVLRPLRDLASGIMLSLLSSASGLVVNAPVQPAIAPAAMMRQQQQQLAVSTPASVSIFPTQLFSSLIDDEAEAYAAKTKAIQAKVRGLHAVLVVPCPACGGYRSRSRP